MSSGLIYNSCIYDTWRGLINFESGRFRVLLCSSEYQPDRADHNRRSDVGGEVEAEGYTLGGARVSVAIQPSPDDDAIDISLGGARWPRASISARYAVYFHDNGGDASDDELIACIDFGEDVTSTNGTFALAESTLRIRNA